MAGPLGLNTGPINGIGLTSPNPAAAPAAAPREVNTAAAAVRAQPKPKPKPKPAPQPSGIPQFGDNPLAAIGVILGQVAAGFQGREGPVERAQGAALEQRAMQMRAAALGLSAMETVATTLPTLKPEQMDAFIEGLPEIPGIDLKAVARASKDGQLEGLDETIAGLKADPTAMLFLSEVDLDGRSPAEVKKIADKVLAFKQDLAKTREKEKIKEASKPKKEVEVVQGGTSRAKELGIAGTGQFEVKLEDGKPVDVNTLGKPETTVNVSLSDAAEKEAIKLSSEADTLSNQTEELLEFRRIARETETDALMPISGPIQEILAAGNINVGDARQIPLRQVFEALQNQQALRFRNPESGFGLTGNTSDRDVKFLKDTVANLSNTPEGNEAILTILAARSRRQALLKQEKADFLFEKGTLTGWAKRRREVVDKTPFFDPAEEEFMKGLSAKAARAEDAIDIQNMSDDDLLTLPADSDVDPDEFEKELQRRGLL